QQIWEVISQSAVTQSSRRNEVLFSGSIAPYCNLSEVMEALLRWLIDAGPSKYLIYHRIEDCVRPEQTRGLRAQNHVDVALHTDAVLPSGPLSRAMTAELRIKQMAWHTALAAGVPTATDWVTEAVDLEENPYAQHSILEIAAC